MLGNFTIEQVTFPFVCGRHLKHECWRVGPLIAALVVSIVLMSQYDTTKVSALGFAAFGVAISGLVWAVSLSFCRKPVGYRAVVRPGHYQFLNLQDARRQVTEPWPADAQVLVVGT